MTKAELSAKAQAILSPLRNAVNARARMWDAENQIEAILGELDGDDLRAAYSNCTAVCRDPMEAYERITLSDALAFVTELLGEVDEAEPKDAPSEEVHSAPPTEDDDE